MYSDHESKSGKFLRSTGGGIAYYGSLVAAPIALIFGISSIGPDYNKTTNPDSQTALAAYTQEGQSLTQLFDEAKMLREAAVSKTRRKRHWISSTMPLSVKRSSAHWGRILPAAS